VRWFLFYFHFNNIFLLVGPPFFLRVYAYTSFTPCLVVVGGTQSMLNTGHWMAAVLQCRRWMLTPEQGFTPWNPSPTFERVYPQKNSGYFSHSGSTATTFQHLGSCFPPFGDLRIAKAISLGTVTAKAFCLLVVELYILRIIVIIVLS